MMIKKVRSDHKPPEYYVDLIKSKHLPSDETLLIAIGILNIVRFRAELILSQTLKSHKDLGHTTLEPADFVTMTAVAQTVEVAMKTVEAMIVEGDMILDDFDKIFPLEHVKKMENNENT
tara:strand:+ start:91 stop:447 length:357 start_codon:yes stop_codon:yes gene_type:complete